MGPLIRLLQAHRGNTVSEGPASSQPGPYLRPVEGKPPPASQTSTSWMEVLDGGQDGGPSARVLREEGRKQALQWWWWDLETTGIGEDSTREVKHPVRRRSKKGPFPYLDADSKSDLDSRFTSSTLSRYSDLSQPLTSGSSPSNTRSNTDHHHRIQDAANGDEAPKAGPGGGAVEAQGGRVLFCLESMSHKGYAFPQSPTPSAFLSCLSDFVMLVCSSRHFKSEIRTVYFFLP